MHLLKIASLAVPLLVFACSPGGPLTPREAFIQVRHAYTRSDPAMLLNSLSARSLRAMDGAAAIINGMEAGQRAAVLRASGFRGDGPSKVTRREIMLMHLARERKSPAVLLAVRRNVTGIAREKDRAVVTVDNGMDLYFVREGPYWKFDLRSY
jgi:hypothetical protein